ncbi:MAG: NAD(P)-dependent oxidoreductase [Pseudomonadota bacterium]
MLEHLNTDPTPPNRVVILGREGFVASTLAATLEAAGINHLALGHAEHDLTTADAGEQLAAALEETDTLVFVSAIAPSRDAAAMATNMRMVDSVAQAVSTRPVSHLVNISSDAVYEDAAHLVHEGLAPAPGSPHGAMHLAREILLSGAMKGAGVPLAHLRPSLLYGTADPHNGYGPNRFRRQAQAGETITLFGEGEEKRDHVAVEDVAALISQVIQHRSTGILNIATGTSRSFRECAELAVEIAGKGSVSGTPRQNPITHRHFDVTARLKAFPAFSFIDFDEGFRKSFNRVDS